MTPAMTVPQSESNGFNIFLTPFFIISQDISQEKSDLVRSFILLRHLWQNGNGTVRNNGPFQEKEILNGTSNGNLLNNVLKNEFEMNKTNKLDDEFHAKIGHGMDMSIPATANGKPF